MVSTSPPGPAYVAESVLHVIRGLVPPPSDLQLHDAEIGPPDIRASTAIKIMPKPAAPMPRTMRATRTIRRKITRGTLARTAQRVPESQHLTRELRR